MPLSKKPKKKFRPVASRKSDDLDPTRTGLVRQRFLGDLAGLPALLEPAVPDVELSEWVEAHRERVEELIRNHGGVLFRGFGVSSVEEFQRLCQAICPSLFGEYGDLPTERHTDKIYGATPYPADKVILFHNESSHTHRWPARQFFHCVQVAQEGGETPLVDGRRVWERLDQEVRDRFRQVGLLYERNFKEGFDVSWQQFFRTVDRRQVEATCDELGIEWEWFGDELRTRQWAPAMIEHPATGESTFFNQIQLHHVACLEPEVRSSIEELFEEGRWPRNVYYGDGSPIPDDLVQDICDLYWELSVQFPWQEGDVIAVDNMLVSHARNTYQGPRKLVVAMGDMVSAEEMRRQGRARWETPASRPAGV